MAWDRLSVSAMLAALLVLEDKAAVQREMFARVLVHLTDSGVQSPVPFVGTKPIWGARTVDGGLVPPAARVRGACMNQGDGRRVFDIPPVRRMSGEGPAPASNACHMYVVLWQLGTTWSWHI